MTAETITRAEPRTLSGRRTRTREEIRTRAMQAAAGLASLGVTRGDTIALLLRNDFEFFEAAQAANALGASPVAINWHLAPQEVAYVLNDCAAKVLIAHADLLRIMGDAIPKGITVIGIATPPEITGAYGLPAGDGQLDTGQTEWNRWLEGFQPLNEVCRDFVETMLYTSGTTGKPKGVRRFPQTPEAAAKFLELRDFFYGIKPGIRALICGPMYHAAPNAFAMRAITQAEELVLMPRFDPEEFLAYVQRHRITTIFMVPTMFVRLLKLPAEVRARYDTSSLQHVLTAAAHCPPAAKAAMADWWGPIIHEFLGGTESSYISYCAPEDAAKKPGTVGRLVEGVKVRFIGGDGSDVPPGEPGEIHTRLGFAADFTYENREAERRAIELEDGLIATGDVGYLDEDGYLFLCDRKKDMVISGGVNIYPAEIEAELIKLPGVRDCAVFGVPHPEFGESLMAVVQLDSSSPTSAEAITAALKDRLAGFKIPRAIEFRDSLPRDDAGKIYKRKLRDPYWQ
jgi:long-chain acyl-CoA synthetase